MDVLTCSSGLRQRAGRWVGTGGGAGAGCAGGGWADGCSWGGGVQVGASPYSSESLAVFK